MHNRVFLSCALACCAIFLAAQAPGRTPARAYPIRPVPFYDVTVDDQFWAPRIERNRTASIPHIMRENERTGRVANFEKAAGLKRGDYEGKRFNDTDVYKAIEAASYTLKTHPDPALESALARLVDLIARSQLPDGYLYPARTLGTQVPGIGPGRYINLNGSHELYNFGHMYEAAIAWQLATGRDDFLAVALKNAALVGRDFGPSARKAVPGHEEIELALVKLYQLTGDERYFRLARFFLDQRGHEHDTQPYPADSLFRIYNDRDYMQDHLPVIDQATAVGHAVRAMYLYSAMTDVAALAEDVAYRNAVDRLWTDVVSKRLYITGGLGSRGANEGFGDDYELPNKEAYAETCASVGNSLWNERLFLMQGDGRYVDVLERTLYNGLLSGVSVAGDRFFYENPLESAGDVERSEYFDVACCPSNLARLMAQLPGLIYARHENDVFVKLFVGSGTEVLLPSARVALRQQTRYPWEGKVRLTVTPSAAAEFTLRVRIPGWARQQPVPSDLYRFADRTRDAPVLSVNGQSIPLDVESGFARIQRRWSPGDVVELDLPMPVRRVLAHQGVKADRGRGAIERGPIVYAVEAADNNGDIASLVLPLSVVLKHEFRPSLLGGVGVVTGPGTAVDADDRPHAVRVTAIPYYAWANRGKGEMAVWVPYERGR